MSTSVREPPATGAERAVASSPPGSAAAPESCPSCPICLEPIMEDRPFIVSACGHVACHPCATKHAISCLLDQMFPVPCPVRGACSAALSHRECAQLLSHQHEWVSGGEREVRTAWQVLRGFELKRTVGAERLCPCPGRECEEVIVVDYPWKMRDQPVQCPECGTLLCAHCRTDWHHGLTCREFKQLPEHVKRSHAAVPMERRRGEASKDASKTAGQQPSQEAPASRPRSFFRRWASRCLR